MAAVPLLVTAVVLATLGSASGQQCTSPNALFNASATQSAVISQGLVLWQGVVLILCFGVFALFVALLHRLIRSCIFYDNHLLDTFFDAGGDSNFAIIACAVVARWLWTASFTWSSSSVLKYGLVGHFWHSASGSIHLLLFAIVAAEIRIKAPGAKTFLQVIHSRFGMAPHITVMIFALIVNIIISGMIMMEGTRILTSLVSGVSKEAICVLLAVAVGVYTVVGGVGGGLYMSFFACALIVSIMLVYFTDTFFNPRGLPNPVFPNGPLDVYNAVCGVPGPAGNSQSSMLTFMSRGGMLEGIVIILSGFSSVFVNQSFWSAAVASKPTHAVWGYLTGALAWFGIPFMLSFTFGMSYLAMAGSQGHNLMTDSQSLLGYVPVYMSNQLIGQTGDFVMYSLTLAVVITSCSSEILSISSIIVYDIYQAYISPFAPAIAPGQAPFVRRKLEGEEYVGYNRKCVFIKYVIVTIVAILLYPITLILLAIGIDLQWLFMFIGVLCGSNVIPIVLSITWHRTTGAGVISGVIFGMVCGVVSWLVYASTFPNGLAWFRGNTGRPEVFIVGTAVSLGVGGLVCFFISLSCGGCDPNRHEVDEWEKCRQVDNPMMPWSVRYAPNLANVDKYNGLPHFYEIRRTFRCAEVSAYVIGIFLSCGAIFIWPALMLLAGVFSYQTFLNWTWLVLIWGAASAIFLCVFPLMYEVLSLCYQAYNSRAWVQSDRQELMVFEEGPSVTEVNAVSTFVKPTRLGEVRAVRTLGGLEYATGCGTCGAAKTMQSYNEIVPVFAGTMRANPQVYGGTARTAGGVVILDPGSTYARLDTMVDGRSNAERWKTFINLD